jgi:hypothetical protein
MESRGAKRTGPARAPILLLVLSSSIALAGCASSRIPPIDASKPIELAAEEGLLIIQIDTEVALSNLILNHRSVARSLSKGRHIWLTRVREGSYRWQEFETGDQVRYRRTYELDSDDEMRFYVQAGTINYPGELVIRASPQPRLGDDTLIVRNRNHAAMAVRALQKRYPRLLQSRALHYAGSGDDAFLDYYTRERDKKKAPSASAAGAEDRAETQAETP